MYRLRTDVSQAFWCKPRQDPPYFSLEPAWWTSPAEGGHSTSPVCWLDHQLEGGIHVPTELLQRPGPRHRKKVLPRAVTLLVSGPPGSGKSALAMELCYRWSLLTDPQHLADRPTGLHSLYVSTEDDAKRTAQKALSFGWKHADIRFEPWKPHEVTRGVVSILGLNQDHRPDARSRDASRTIQGILKKWNTFVANRFLYPDVLVIDSLSVFPEPGDAFRQFVGTCTTGPMITIFVLESGARSGAHPLWSHMCDLEIRVDRQYSTEYMLRTIEVVKARHQPHVWGRQQLKIYPKTQAAQTPAAPSRPGVDAAYAAVTEARRRHPYREEGGTFIYPSIHYYLSVYKRQFPATAAEHARTPLESLNQALLGGFPRGRCSAFIGVRGGHKSHLGYFHLLANVLRGEKALIVSLRDDEGMANMTMTKIMRQQFVLNPDWHDRLPTPPPSRLPDDDYSYEVTLLRQLENRGSLEILYYPPGYISPDEFFHRLFVCIRQMKSGDGPPPPITVLFNSLDQLSARFPLCAKENIFVPGLIEMFTAEKITSIFVTVTAPDQPNEQYGLLPMADLILSFGHRRFRRSSLDYLRVSAPAPAMSAPLPLAADPDPMVQAVMLSIMRMPGGETAGARGVLELTTRGGLNFIRIPDGFAEGDAAVGWAST